MFFGKRQLFRYFHFLKFNRAKVTQVHFMCASLSQRGDERVIWLCENCILNNSQVIVKYYHFTYAKILH